MDYGVANMPYDDEVMVVDEDPSPASRRPHSAWLGLDTACGQQLAIRSPNIDSRNLAELVKCWWRVGCFVPTTGAGWLERVLFQWS